MEPFFEIFQKHRSLAIFGTIGFIKTLLRPSVGLSLYFKLTRSWDMDNLIVLIGEHTDKPTSVGSGVSVSLYKEIFGFQKLIFTFIGISEKKRL